VQWCYNLLTRGMRNAAVFPEPVLEHATISCPARISGIA
jgi:hypothetical protein